MEREELKKKLGTSVSKIVLVNDSKGKKAEEAVIKNQETTLDTRSNNTGKRIFWCLFGNAAPKSVGEHQPRLMRRKLSSLSRASYVVDYFFRYVRSFGIPLVEHF